MDREISSPPSAPVHTARPLQRRHFGILCCWCRSIEFFQQRHSEGNLFGDLQSKCEPRKQCNFLHVANGSRTKTKTHFLDSFSELLPFLVWSRIKPLKTSDPRFDPEYGPEGITKCTDASLWEFMLLVNQTTGCNDTCGHFGMLLDSLFQKCKRSSAPKFALIRALV